MAANDAETGSNISAASQDQADGWSIILGIILIYLENIKWLILLPLAAGLITAAWVYSVDRVYLSSTLIGPLDDVSARVISALTRAPDVLDQALAKVPQFEAGKPADERRQKLAQQTSFEQPPVGREAQRLLPSERVYRLEVSDSNPAQAQAQANAIGQAVIARFRQMGSTNLKMQIDQKREQLADIEKLVDKLKSRISDERMLSSARSAEVLGAAESEAASAFGLLLRALQLRAEAEARVDVLQARIAGSQHNLLLVSASLPTSPIWPPRRTYIVNAIIVSFVLLAVLFLLIGVGRHVVALSATRSDMAEKIRRIDDLLRLRKWRDDRRAG
jgi:hypothetical protein